MKNYPWYIKLLDYIYKKPISHEILGSHHEWSGFHIFSMSFMALNGHVAQLSFIETDVTRYGDLGWGWTLKSCWNQWEENYCYLLRHLNINHCPTLNIWYIHHQLPTFTIKNEPNLGIYKYTIHWFSCSLSTANQRFGQEASSRCFKFCLPWNETFRKSRRNDDGRNQKQPSGIYKTFEIIGLSDKLPINWLAGFFHQRYFQIYSDVFFLRLSQRDHHPHPSTCSRRWGPYYSSYKWSYSPNK